MWEVIYHSQGGSTEKVATAIADELHVKARHVESVTSLPEGVDIFLGSGLYFMRPSRLIRHFIRDNNFRGRKIALFGTSSTGVGIETMLMERLLKRKGAIVIGKYYCAGRFYFFRGGRPAGKDLEKAKAFARSLGIGSTTSK